MSFYFFRRYFFSRRAGSLIRWVSWISLMGLAVSLSALILIMSIMEGFGQAIKTRLLSKSAHLTLNLEGPPLPVDNEKGQSLFLGKEKWPFPLSSLSLEQKKGIQSAVFFETQELILQSPKGFKGVLATGHSDSEWDKMRALSSSFEETTDGASSLFEAKVPLPQSIPLREKGVFLSQELAQEIGIFSGDIHLIPLAGLLLPPLMPPPIKKFKIKGLLPVEGHEKSGLSLFYPKGLMDFGDFSKIQYGAEIRFFDPEKAPFYQNLLRAHSSQTWMEANSSLFFALKLEKFIMILFLSLAGLLSCMGLSSAFFLLITQKTEDLAILQAMGLSQKRAVRLFTRLGMFLALLGISAGALLAWAMVAFLKLNRFSFLPEMYQDRSLPAQIMPVSYLLVLVGAFICSWISCYLPAKRVGLMRLSDLLKATVF